MYKQDIGYSNCINLLLSLGFVDKKIQHNLISDYVSKNIHNTTSIPIKRQAKMAYNELDKFTNFIKIKIKNEQRKDNKV